MGQLQSATRASGDDPALLSLLDEVTGYPGVAEAAATTLAPVDPVLTFRLRYLDGGELSMFTTMTRFGTPQDVTLDELAIELFYPADDPTEEILRRDATHFPLSSPVQTR